MDNKQVKWFYAVIPLVNSRVQISSTTNFDIINIDNKQKSSLLR